MQKICPNPIFWNQVFERLVAHAQSQSLSPSMVPKPLILVGWAYSNDAQKKARWDETIAWADLNGGSEIVSGIPDSDFYCAKILTTYEIGPMGGPMYRPWDCETKQRPSQAEIEKCMATLTENWLNIVGEELGKATRPIKFSGKKLRRLLAFADTGYSPIWGGWTYRSEVQHNRVAFTAFRASINKTIAPHEVDHVDFVSSPIPSTTIKI